MNKQSRLDVLVVTEANERINVEIQFTNKYDSVKRSIYYWSGIYRQQMKKGMAYTELHPVISINILNFNLFEQTDRFHTTFQLYEDEDRFGLTNMMEFHYLEMGKLIKDWKVGKLDPWNDVLARWLLMLGMVDRRNDKIYQDIYKELEDIAMKDDTLRSAFNDWEEISLTQEQRIAYESRLKRVLDEEAFHREMELKLEKGMREIEKSKQEVEKSKLEVEKSKQEAEKSKQEAEKSKREAEKSKREVEKGKQEIKKREREIEEAMRKIEKARREVREKGIAEGKVEGRAEGQAVGKEEVELEAKEAIARRLLVKGLEVEIIAEVTGLEIERIHEIK